MTIEEKRERNRMWRHNNPDKIREYQRNALRRKYVDDFLADRQKQTNLGKKELVTNGQIIPT